VADDGERSSTPDLLLDLNVRHRLHFPDRYIAMYACPKVPIACRISASSPALGTKPARGREF
ncbi:MAG: hypothetical protein KDF63_07630, partial [Rhodoferax sp.]|nr:hypothetical protein [Rhodoferax sp.]